jgi:hypothetical protein
MGADTSRTVREIEDVRERLTHDLTELQARLPASIAWGRRLLGVALGSGVMGGAVWFVVRRLRGRRSRAVQTVVQVVPHDLAGRLGEALEDEHVRQWLFAIGAAWVLLRLGELRELRRLHRSTLGAWG